MKVLVDVGEAIAFAVTEQWKGGYDGGERNIWRQWTSQRRRLRVLVAAVEAWHLK